MKYNKPYDQTNTDAAYVNGNPATNTAGSIPCAEGLEYPQREIVAAITAAGMVPSNSDLTQLSQAIAKLSTSTVTTIIKSRNIIGGKTLPFLSSTSWLCPDGVFLVRARGVAGGGGGGGSQSSAGGAASGGGAGGYFDGIFTVVPGTTYTITIGPGGAAGLASGAGAGNGSATSFDAFASAIGGGAGLAANGNTASPGGTSGGANGGTVNLFGSAGGNGLQVGSIYFGGQGGPSRFLGGGYTAIGIVGQQGTQFGGGGGGGAYQNNGAAGAPGYLELTY
ncbi:hypothetical protein [Methylobacterium brachiatum]|uniref:glycine-rich domain-containing protein n=1 Tax=Methylobacterium brachiatum TaxID=269660 RepID=UPI00244A45C6|nr:hypothetical protein [Methylobacterium brachiatum]MDH2313158.1 hypothetical protein [Methylobacterium brachiatum]